MHRLHNAALGRHPWRPVDVRLPTSRVVDGNSIEALRCSRRGLLLCRVGGAIVVFHGVSLGCCKRWTHHSNWPMPEPSADC
jgi:hypothetical protein